MTTNITPTYNKYLKILTMFYILELIIFALDYKQQLITTLWYQITFLTNHMLVFIFLIVNTIQDIKNWHKSHHKIRLLILVLTFTIWLIIDLPLILNITQTLQHLQTSFSTFKWSFSIIVIICILTNITTLLTNKTNKKH